MIQENAELRDYFQQNKPEIPQNEEFLEELEKCMDAMNEIKRIQQCTEKRYRRMMAIALLTGLSAGAALAALILLKPFNFPTFKLEILSYAAMILAKWKEAIFLLIALTAIALSLRKTSPRSL